MKSYAVGNAVTVGIPFIDLDGDPVTPTALSYNVTDENGAEILGDTTLSFSGGDTDASIEVLGAHNAAIGARVVTLTITTADGVYTQQAMYRLVSQRLVFLENTFQTMVQAQLTSADMPKLFGWNAANPVDQTSALIESYTRLVRMNYMVRWPQDIDDQSIYHIDLLNRISPVMWPLMTEDIFSRYPAVFVKALRQAQIAEANDILTVDPIGDKRRAGLFSETVGESSMMFRSGPRPYRGQVCNAAMTYLTGYLDNKIVLTRG